MVEMVINSMTAWQCWLYIVGRRVQCEMDYEMYEMSDVLIQLFVGYDAHCHVTVITLRAIICPDIIQILFNLLN